MNKTDGNRPLCVWVKWHIVNNKLAADIQFNEPLKTRANNVMDNTKKLLDQLNISGELFKDNIQRFYDFEV